MGRLCRVGVPLGFVTCPKHIAVRKCNYRAEMTVLNVGHFAAALSRNTPQVCGRRVPKLPTFALISLT